MRLALTYPLAVTFAVLGVDDVSLTLLPLAGTALTAPLLGWLAMRWWGEAEGVAAGLLFAAFPLSIASTRPRPC
jgi:hypothetical protein